MIQAFNFASTPQLIFGTGKISNLAPALKTFGTKALIVTGARSFTSSPCGILLAEQLSKQALEIEYYKIAQEPTPALVDGAVKQYANMRPDVVVAIGGGSVLDAGKAISAMLPLNTPVKDYLEGVGTKQEHPGRKVPFIAIPTTAGTGSEATKNAVLSEVGPEGYKRSLRHHNFVPNLAIIDPSLTLTCPAVTTAASGMDAFTQLLESYLSTGANPLTDAYAITGLNLVSKSLLQAYRHGTDVEARADMALAAFLSGVTLANAGLGLVHGFASSIGGYFDIPHGVICSALMGPVNKLTVRKLRSAKNNESALMKYALVGKMFSTLKQKNNDYYIDSLIALLESWTGEMNIPKLTQLGITPVSHKKIAQATDNKNNPIALNSEEILEVLEMLG